MINSTQVSKKWPLLPGCTV